MSAAREKPVSAAQIAAIAFLLVMVALILRGIRGNKGPVRLDGNDGLGPGSIHADGSGGGGGD